MLYNVLVVKTVCYSLYMKTQKVPLSASNHTESSFLPGHCTKLLNCRENIEILEESSDVLHLTPKTITSSTYIIGKIYVIFSDNHIKVNITKCSLSIDVAEGFLQQLVQYFISITSSLVNIHFVFSE